MDDLKKVLMDMYNEFKNLDYVEYYQPYNHKSISLNGVDDYEDFFIDLNSLVQNDYSSNKSFGCCKTARKPYDKIVVAYLIILAHYGLLEASSDGDEDDWKAGHQIAKRFVPDCKITLKE
jgi:hypothetical protein